MNYVCYVSIFYSLDDGKNFFETYLKYKDDFEANVKGWWENMQFNL